MLSGACGKAVWRVSRGCLKWVWILSGGCEKTVGKLWRGYLQCLVRLYGNCGETVWRGYVKVIWRVWGESLRGHVVGGCMDVGRQSGVCGEALWSVRRICM